jgi:hypothetical protein
MRGLVSDRGQQGGEEGTYTMSVISAVPVWPALPTLTTGAGLDWLANALPPPMIVGHAWRYVQFHCVRSQYEANLTSPTRREPGGTVSVFVT